MSPAAVTVIHHRMLRTASHLVDHPAIISVYFGDDDTVEATTAAGRTIRLVPEPHDVHRPSATRVSMNVVGRPEESSRPSFDELIDPTRSRRAVIRLLRRTVTTQTAEAIPVGTTTLAALMAPDRQSRHAQDHFGHLVPDAIPSLSVGFPRPGTDSSSGATIEVMVQADGLITCHGADDLYPEVTEAWLAVIDRHAGVERGTVLTALAQLASAAFTDADLVALGG